MMDQEQLQKAVLILSKQLLALNDSLSEIKAFVKVLVVQAATQMNPAHPEEAIKDLNALQKKAVQTDPHAQETKDAREMIERMEEWMRHGGGPGGES